MRLVTVRFSRSILVALTAFAVGCSPVDAPPVDSGTITDIGIVVDAGPTPDAGPDGGPVVDPDGGPDDGGVIEPTDAGIDGGAVEVLDAGIDGGPVEVLDAGIDGGPVEVLDAGIDGGPVEVPDAGADGGTVVESDGGPVTPTDGGTVVVAPIAVAGTWDDRWGGRTTITDQSWGSTTVVSFDNDAHSAVTQSPANDLYNPNKFNKFVWTPVVDGAFWFCWLTYGEDTAEAAQNTALVADASSPASGGCGPFSWTRMFAPIEVEGVWDDSYRGTTQISSFAWGSTEVTRFNNAGHYAITQSPPDDQYNPNKFNKFVWTPVVDGTFWFCWLTYGEDTADAAESTSLVADDSDPANGGCGSFSWTLMFTPLAVTGTWDDNWGGTTSISSWNWGSTSVVGYDNEARYAITQSPPNDPYNPNKFNKFVWTPVVDGTFWFCWLTYGEDTAEAAANTPLVADATDPANGGCGGFSWTFMFGPIETKGTWDDNWGGTTEITSLSWGSTTMVEFDNAHHYAITQSPPDDLYNPNKYNKFVWTPVVDGGFWFCWLTYGEATADAARNTALVADASDPANGGCGGFSWTRMFVPLELTGTWDDEYGSTTAISSWDWGDTSIVGFDNAHHFAITQSPPDDLYNPNKFNKFVWTPVVDGGFWFCWLTYGEDTAEDAANTTLVADATDPANGGCGPFSWTRMFAPIAVKGTWDDNYGGSTVITSLDWGNTAIKTFDNAGRYAITQSPPDDLYNPNKFNKFVWTPVVDGGFWFCWLTYGEDTAEDAANTTLVADATDPANSGCGAFSWTRMVTPIETRGTWDDNYGGNTTITSFDWGDTKVLLTDNVHRIAITQNASDAPFSPGLFNKFVWTPVEDGSFWFCWVAYGQPSAAAALANTAVADATDPASGGCGGFSWTAMRVPLAVDGVWNAGEPDPTFVNAFQWGGMSVELANNAEGYAITKTAQTASVDPGTFSKIVWTTPTGGAFWACTIASGQATAAAALGTSNIADASDPEHGGCLGQPWTPFVSVPE